MESPFQYETLPEKISYLIIQVILPIAVTPSYLFISKVTIVDTLVDSKGNFDFDLGLSIPDKKAVEERKRIYSFRVSKKKRIFSLLKEEDNERVQRKERRE